MVSMVACTYLYGYAIKAGTFGHGLMHRIQCSRCNQDLYVLRRLADVVQPLIRRFTADETDEKMGGVDGLGAPVVPRWW